MGRYFVSKSIVMGPVSELGPIEPSINDIPTTILEQDEIAKNNFPLHMIGKYALQQTKSLAKRLLADGMMKGRPDAEIDGVVQTLASRDKYHSHGSVINHVEAKSMGLAVEYLTNGDPIWDRLDYGS